VNCQPFLRFSVAALPWLTATLASAHGVNPVGLWKTVDDRSGEARWLVRIVWEKQTDNYKGIIEKILPVSSEANSQKCDKCEGAHQGEPVLGLTLISGIKGQDGDYRGGEFLDPDEGQVYRCMLRLSQDGKTIILRTFRGVSFGRTQTWRREE
jgi:uncharacterized protein (DUF2147 family)